jgi:transcriptional regulator with XRE-family HTH domain
MDDTIGDKIRIAREQSGLTRAQLAEKLDVSWQAMHKMEQKDSIQATRLLQVARMLQRPLSFFLGPEVLELEGLAREQADPEEAKFLYILKNFPPETRSQLHLYAMELLVRDLEAGRLLLVRRPKP